ncbi:Breast cancer type 1 susceptibility-like protein [Armadillidium nasatum]|uniref:Breast cancer type 1 susceptibility-like protein n=1 Tax=Armadillidium nasatum TaxID=96803 RepID=A0A5N5SKE1_9CRUS|nr:Breast cancer type 1 susceptibility-like protein [Armadillidium nasatum]
MFEENCSIDSVLHRMQSTLACRICLDLLSNPLTTKCGHTFCKECLDRLHISGKASYPCPLCMTPITRRSLNQNAKISTLVSAVRNVISSIKQDCGVQEVSKNVGNPSETTYEEEELEEAPIRRTTRKNKPISFYMDESFAHSKKRINKKIKDKEDTGENTKSGYEENKTTVISSKESSDKVNGHLEEFLIPAFPNKPVQSKVEQWLSKNQVIKCGEENSDNFEDLQPTQIFAINDVTSKSDVVSKENPNSTNAIEGNDIWTSQCSTVIFNYNEEFLTSNVKPGTSKKFEEERTKEETNSTVSEKENEKDSSDVKQAEKRRGSKRILFEPNKMDNAKKTNIKKNNITLQESNIHNKDVEAESMNAKLLPIVNKPSNKNELSLRNTEDAASKTIVNCISNEAIVQAEHKQQPNSKGHNIRFVSNLKVSSVDQLKPSKLSRGKNRKSPGWSRVEGARRDLRSKQMSLNITGGEQKLLPSSASKLESSNLNINSSQESVIIIDDQTQTEKSGKHLGLVAQKSKKLSNMHRNNFSKGKTSNNSCSKNANSSNLEPKISPKLKELELKLTRLEKEEKDQICESIKTHDIFFDKEIVDLNVDTNNILSFKQHSGNITLVVEENKILDSNAAEETDKSQNGMGINKGKIQNIDNSFIGHENKEPPQTNFNKGELSQRNCDRNNITEVRIVEVNQNVKNLSNSLTSNICIGDIDANSKTDDNGERIDSKTNEEIKEYSKESPEIKIDNPKNLVNQQETNEIQNLDEPPKASVSFIQKGNFDTKRDIPNSSCHHSIPCELFHVLAKYSKYLISESEVSSCNYAQRCQKNESIKQREGGLTSASESTVIAESCIDTYEQNVAIILPDKVPGTRFKYVENINCKTKNSNSLPNQSTEDYNLDSKAVESDSLNHTTESIKQSKMFELPSKISDDKYSNDLKSVEVRSKCSAKEVSPKECEKISENQMGNSFSRTETRSHTKSSSMRYDESQIEKDLFSENEEEMNESLSLLSTQKPLKSLSADSPIAFKRNRRIKRIESPNSSSDDELNELIKPQKKRTRIFSCTSSTSVKPNLENSPKIDSEEMRDFERYDENVWHYFKDKIEKDKNCVDKEKDKTVTIENNKETSTDVHHIDDTSDDDVIPCTDEVLKNIEADLPAREKEKQVLMSENPTLKKLTQTVELLSQDSVTGTTTSDLNSSVRELFDKCNTSLHNAYKILNKSQLSQDIGKDKPITCEDVKVNFQINEGMSILFITFYLADTELIEKGEEMEEEKTENESHFSMLSTDSPVLMYPAKEENGGSMYLFLRFKSEVEALKNRIKILEEEMKQKSAQLNNGNKNSSKTNTEACANSVNEIDQINALKTSDEPGRDSDEDSEELFTTFPDLIKKCGGSVVKSFCEENPGPKVFIVDAEDTTFNKNEITDYKPVRVMVGHDWVIECIGNYAHVALSNYLAAFESEWIHRIYLTKILKDFECDTFLPQIEYDSYKLIDDPTVPNGVQEEGDVKYRYEVYEKITNASQ